MKNNKPNLAFKKGDLVRHINFLDSITIILQIKHNQYGTDYAELINLTENHHPKRVFLSHLIPIQPTEESK